ncbi:MAG: hypothetical protein WCC01_15285 [Acidimicrobiia bacterium]
MEGINAHHSEGLACAVCARVAVADISDGYLREEHGLEMMVTIDLRAGDPIVTVVAA